MACGCNKGGSSNQWEVVADGGNGKVLFPGGTQATAKAVALRYPGSIARPKGSTEIAPKTA
ncbi:hypothetical protein [Streptomyces sp. NRRL S-350]|uniref:hypothetical protein n=1 Tax=Streptomyces sp. NRRL S-350 TaxID=1463902 RepID=UPI0004BFB99B|nr:hypothetical protein [Streptomyces sp. NRRL S-350]